MNIVQKITFNTFKDFYQAIGPSGNLSSKLKGFIFRGQASSSYQLLPVALRYSTDPKSKFNIYDLLKMTKLNRDVCLKDIDSVGTQIIIEYDLLATFYRIANFSGLHVPQINYFIFSANKNFIVDKMPKKDFYWIHNEIIELAALAQHYGVPTRLLDWSFDIYVALYFAVKGACCLIDEHDTSNDSFDLWAINYNFFQEDRTKFPQLKFIVPSYRNNKNLCAQKGILSYIEINNDEIVAKNSEDIFFLKKDMRPLDSVINDCSDKFDRTILYKISFPYSCAKEAFTFLNRIGYNASRIFPGYKGVVWEMEEKKFIYG